MPPPFPSPGRVQVLRSKRPGGRSELAAILVLDALERGADAVAQLLEPGGGALLAFGDQIGWLMRERLPKRKQPRLTQRFAEHHAGGDRDVERAHALCERNSKANLGVSKT